MKESTAFQMYISFRPYGWRLCTIIITVIIVISLLLQQSPWQIMNIHSLSNASTNVIHQNLFLHSPHVADSSERSPQSSSKSQVQEIGMQRPLAQENWLVGHVRAEEQASGSESQEKY